MPRSKRKASSAATQAQPFNRKKTKLGVKPRAANYTDTSVKHRQIHVPNQTRAHFQPPPSQLAETKQPITTGLSLQDLLSRTRHHNSNTRTAAHNALTNALTDPKAASYAAINAAPSTIIFASAVAIADPIPSVRTAASNLLRAVLLSIHHLAPFQPLIATQLLACLTHIRSDIRLHAAKSLVSILSLPSCPPPSALFEQSANPLQSLSDLLTHVSTPKARVVVLDAIEVLCRPAIQDSKSKQPSINILYPYHRPITNSTSIPSTTSISPLLFCLPESSASTLLTRVANITTECFPLSEIRQSALKTALFSSVARALSHLPCDHTDTPLSKAALSKALSLWSQQPPTSSLQDAHHHLARSALSAERFHLTAEYLTRTLSLDAGPSGLESTVAQFLMACQTDVADDVVSEWAGRFHRAADKRDVLFVMRCLPVLSRVMRRAVVGQQVGMWRILSGIPRAICLCVDEENNCEGLAEHVADLVGLFVEAFCELRAGGVDEVRLRAVAMDVIRGICREDAVQKVGLLAVDRVVGLAYASELLLCDEVVAFVGRCCAVQFVDIVERFVAGVECVLKDGRGKGKSKDVWLRAIAMGRVIYAACGTEEQWHVTRSQLGRMLMST